VVKIFLPISGHEIYFHGLSDENSMTGWILLQNMNINSITIASCELFHCFSISIVSRVNVTYNLLRQTYQLGN
jgi:hypothetical protein